METDDDVEFIAEHLAEASVYRTYGFSDKAWDECVLVLHRFPNNAEARALLESLDWKADARRKALYKEITGRDWPDAGS